MKPENPTDRSKLVVLALVGLIYSVSIAYVLPRLQLYGNDFFARWYASKMLLTTGRGLYDWANAYELARITGWHQVYDFRFYYPASLLIFTAPLSLLPYRVAVTFWIVFGLWCLWLSMVIFARLLDTGLSVNRLTWLLILMTTAVPVLQHTAYTQFNSLVAFALALTYYGLCRQKYLLAGLVAFVTPLVVSGPTGFHISSAEAVYRFTLPVWLGLLTWPLMPGSTTARPQTNHQLQGACGD